MFLKYTVPRNNKISPALLPVKIFYTENRSVSLEKKYSRDYKDGSGLLFLKFDFVAGGQEIKIALLVEF